jgi:phenylpropionate dioxygenase-like ring-hydroxylating dioxygenase large terminal subunit
MSTVGNEFSAQPASLTPDAELLFGFWYPVVRTNLLRKGKLVTATVMGIPVLCGRREDGQVFCLRDLCPHRGIPLSYGWFDGKNVQCPYHGWKFVGISGQCTEIPSLTADQRERMRPERIFCGAYPSAERDGFLWAYIHDPMARRYAGTPPEVPEVPKFSDNYTLTHLTADLPCNVDHGIIGLMDPAHGPIVHQAWWWRSGASIHEKTKHFEPIPYGFRMASHSPSKNSAPYKLLGVYGESVTTMIDFVLPNRRYEVIRAGKKWFASLTTVTPVTANSCRIDVIAAWNIFRHVPFVLPIARFFGKKFVAQDQQTMVQQAQGLRHNPTLMLIDDADKPAKWYFALKNAYLRHQQTGEEFEHPIAGPVTLHWRS